ncbi:histidine acid phosphatase [Parathielavia hyrcaniae]|uniref:Histidine acid phosphatase n=1 Tax=Parathielavia hyrcaniae TaxID=113614 RepID=A0AAN6SWZ7_9PEZI|nr:histidine acid phosphatase [Parathielavia hyrcaniae]
MPVVAGSRLLAPPQDILIDTPSESATGPLRWLGANSPWFAGPNVNGIDPEVPENCYVEQAAYAVRHGSRYPDTGAYNGWVAMQQKFAPENGYTASGSLAFLPTWRTVLTHPSMQIAMQSPTGAKEAFDMGYTLRTRYPDLYTDGEPFIVWANNYTRVLQTAKMFVHGYLGPFASTYGSVVSVTSRGFPEAVGNSLGPSDMCPNFKDTSGAAEQAIWTANFLPPTKQRLQAMIKGNLTLTDGDVLQIPYLCGFESQITGRLSPWCDIFTDDELMSYQYHNDLRYYYGVGPGTDLNKKLMMPFVDSLVGLLAQGPSNITGISADGSAPFAVPKLLMAFMNDGQLNEMAAAVGVFDEEPHLDPSVRDDDRLFMTSRFSTQRGTIALERLNCVTSKVCRSRPTNGTTMPAARLRFSRRSDSDSDTGLGLSSVARNETFVRIRLNDAVYPIPSCKGGPGSSCRLSDYRQFIADKYAAQGNWAQNCNVTLPGAPETVHGASFFTNLSGPHLQVIAP